MPLSLEKVIERSVDSLQKIYAVVIALAISQAIQTLLRGSKDQVLSSAGDVLDAMPAFVAFVVTLVPFYHGMNRHLDHCYLEKPEADVRQGALLFDFGVFFVEAGLLFAAAWLIRSGLWAFACLGSLLLVDMLWGGLSHLIHYWGHKPSIVRWSVINLIAGGAALLVALMVYPSKRLPLILMIIAIGRTVCDYGFCWKFYFPRIAAASE